MSEKQWRVVADRDKGDDPKIGDAEDGDLLAFRKGREFEADYLVRIERPVPTSTWRDKHGDEWIEDAGGLMHSFETAPFPREHVEKKWGPLVPVGAHPSPHPPTREQIVQALGRYITEGQYERVLALIQNGADR